MEKTAQALKNSRAGGKVHPHLFGSLLFLLSFLAVSPLITGCLPPQSGETGAEAAPVDILPAPAGNGKTVTEAEGETEKDQEKSRGAAAGPLIEAETETEAETQQIALPANPQAEENPFPPNELGEIMILMYHEIGHPEGEWRRTPENFRRDLQTLYEGGYRLVHLEEVVRGEINIPRGKTPVVLTFDDGNRGNFNYLEGEHGHELDPDCAVAILEAFNAAHPDFGVAATFYINYPHPFRQPEYTALKLNYLVEKGFALGNHTYGHADLSRLGPKEIQRELALHQQYTEKYVPGYTVSSLALPYGAYPREHRELLLKGSYGDTTYHHLAVLLVGAGPVKSPFHLDFRPARLPRIRASETNTAGLGLYEWLAVFADNPRRRYISDGHPCTVTVPASLSKHLDPAKVGHREIMLYLEEKHVSPQDR